VNDEVRRACWNSIIEVYWIASFYALAGEQDEAFRWLDRSIVLGNRNYIWFKMDPNLDRIRSDVRFQKICDRAFEQAERLKEHFGQLR
jgi:hypothetical protein